MRPIECLHLLAHFRGRGLNFRCARVIAGNERMQSNWIVERTTLDSPLYANIFGRTDDNDDVFIWPYIWVNREQGLTEVQAEEFATALYGGYVAAKAVLLVGLIMTSLLAVSFLFDLRFLLHGGSRVNYRVKPTKADPAHECKPQECLP